MLGFSEACERNKTVILEQLQQLFIDRTAVLEIGSGSGQHATFMAPALPHLQWWPSDVEANMMMLVNNLDGLGIDNLGSVSCLNVTQPRWPSFRVDAVFSANTLHIMSWSEVEAFFQGVGALLPCDGLLVVYGPFRYRGQHTSDSNARFDGWLKLRDPLSGVRDSEAVDRLAQVQALELLQDIAMPANNRLRVWCKRG